MKKSFFIIAMTFLLAGNVMAANVQYTLRVDGITCPFCVATSSKELKKIEGVIRVASNLEEGTIKVCADSQTVLTDDQLTKLFREKGFTYRGMIKQDKCDKE